MRFFDNAGLWTWKHEVTQAPNLNIGKGKIMAANGNLNQEVKTYHGFLALMKWGTVVSVAVAAFVILMIA